MSVIKITLPLGEVPVNGKQVTFVAPCSCLDTEALDIDGELYTVVDALCNCVTGKGGRWAAGATVSVILDVDNKRACILNESGGISTAVAELFGLDESASVDDALRVVAQMSAADGLTMLTVLDEDGNPIQGVTISGLVNKAGEAVTTDANGQALVVCTSATETSFDAPYWDIPPRTEIVQPLAAALNAVTITMPYLQTGEHVLYTASETKQFRRTVPYDICLVGGGGGAGALYFKQSYSNYFPGTSDNRGMVYGGGGGAVNSYYALVPTAETDYEMVVGAGGSMGTATSSSTKAGGVGGTTTFMGHSAVGGNGSGSVYHSNTSNVYDVYKTGSQATAVSNGTASGAAATVYPFDDNTIPAGGGGGSGCYTDLTKDGIAYGGDNPCGGGGTWKYINGTASESTHTASSRAAKAPGGGGGGAYVYNISGYDTSLSSTSGRAGATGGVYIRRPAEEA